MESNKINQKSTICNFCGKLRYVDTFYEVVIKHRRSNLCDKCTSSFRKGKTFDESTKKWSKYNKDNPKPKFKYVNRIKLRNRKTKDLTNLTYFGTIIADKTIMDYFQD